MKVGNTAGEASPWVVEAEPLGDGGTAFLLPNHSHVNILKEPLIAGQRIYGCGCQEGRGSEG